MRNWSLPKILASHPYPHIPYSLSRPCVGHVRSIESGTARQEQLHGWAAEHFLPWHASDAVAENRLGEEPNGWRGNSGCSKVEIVEACWSMLKHVETSCSHKGDTNHWRKLYRSNSWHCLNDAFHSRICGGFVKLSLGQKRCLTEFAERVAVQKLGRIFHQILNTPTIPHPNTESLVHIRGNGMSFQP